MAFRPVELELLALKPKKLVCSGIIVVECGVVLLYKNGAGRRRKL